MVVMALYLISRAHGMDPAMRDQHHRYRFPVLGLG